MSKSIKNVDFINVLRKKERKIKLNQIYLIHIHSKKKNK